MSHANTLAIAETHLSHVFGGEPLKHRLPDGVSSRSVTISIGEALPASQVWERLLRPAVAALAANLPDGPQLFGCTWALYLDGDVLGFEVVTERDPVVAFAAFAKAAAKPD